jgi:hypothetical protein
MLAAVEVSVRHARHPRAMWLAHIICSGPTCTSELEVVIDQLDELEQFNCDCGYGFALLDLSEVELVRL